MLMAMMAATMMNMSSMPIQAAGVFWFEPGVGGGNGAWEAIALEARKPSRSRACAMERRRIMIA